MNPPANWYPDPTQRHDQRYWDGEHWTDHVYTDGVQGIDPVDAATGAADDGAPADGGQVPDDDPGDGAAPADELHDEAVVDVDQAAGGHVDATTAVEPDADVWSPADGVTLGDEDSWDEDSDDEGGDGEAGDDGGGPTTAGDDEAPAQSVAPEVEPEDVVATVEEVDPAPGAEADFSDAFLLSPETASRLVARSTEPELAEEATAAASQEDAPADDGPLDAPPPSMPAPAGATTSQGSLGITGDLVGGAFSEREDTGAVGLQNARLLRCSASGGVIARQGTMVAYQGDVTFARQGAGSVGRVLKRAATGEGLAMMRVAGDGDVFLADAGQHVFLLHLDGGPGLSVNGRNVLAFSAALNWDIERVKGASLLAGGLFNTTLTGTGWVALVSDGEPVVLRTDEAPTYVDVNALVAWSGGLATQITNTVSAKSLVGLGSGEAFQMAFNGAGIVIVQPSEGPLGGASA